MEYIPPQDRFSHHAESNIPLHDVLREAAGRMGIDFEGAGFSRLPGGFMNANFLADAGKEKLVFRIYSTEQETAERESDVMRLVRSRAGIHAPEVFAVFNINGRPVAVMEYVDGITFEDRLSSGEVLGMDVYRKLGEQLGLIHAIEFPDAGFIGPRLRIGKEYENFALFLKEFIETTLDWLEERPDRLDLDTNRRFRRLIRDKWDITSAAEPSRQLVHCDFNPKNILVSRPPGCEVLAIIDWEFCVSGNGLIDIGNFFRFAYDYEGSAVEYFIAGYRTLHPTLPANWRDISLLLDLGNMCGFLERREDYPRSFHTARTVVNSTLAHFGY
jgi:aminoglycoside phosphotransferase (APT) family kinase protein